VDIENQYYNSKGSLEEENWEVSAGSGNNLPPHERSPPPGTAPPTRAEAPPLPSQEALKGFQRVLSLEEEASGKGEWGFKALKQIVKLHHKTGRTEELLTAYEQMLGYIHGSVTKNHAEKKVNSTLDHLSSSTDTSFLQRLYEATLAAVLRAGNDRLWFKTNVKLAHLWVQVRGRARRRALRAAPGRGAGGPGRGGDAAGARAATPSPSPPPPPQREDWGKLARVLRDLRKWCMGEDGGEDPRKGTQLLEVYALEIQMHSEQGNKKALREIYTSALGVKSAIPHPRIMGVVRECGGKMHMRERAWADAATAFFEAFKSYDEAGHPRRLQCLKYLVLATMLNASGVDPFDAQEARPYKSDPEVVAMTGLVAAYQDNRIDHFERLLRQHRREIMGDAFIAGYVQDLLRALRTQVSPAGGGGGGRARAGAPRLAGRGATGPARARGAAGRDGRRPPPTPPPPPRDRRC